METTQTQTTPTAAGKEYAYFERSFSAELFMFMFFGPILAALWIIVFYYFEYSGRLPLPLVKSAVYFTVTLIFAVIFYNNSRLISKAKFIILENDRIVKKDLRKACFIRYDGIRDIRLARVPLFKRWLTLETVKNEKFTIPLGVRNGQEMVEGIFQNMYAAGMFPENSDAQAKRMGVISKRLNMLYDLREKNMPNVVRAVTVVGLLYGAVPALYWNRGLITMVPFGMLCMFLQAGAYLAAEHFHLRTLLRDGRKDVWEDGGKAAYKNYYLISGLAAAIVGMIFGIVITHPI